MSETAERIEESLRLRTGDCVCTDGLPVPEYMLIEKAALQPDGSRCVIAKVVEAVCKAASDSGWLSKVGTE